MKIIFGNHWTANIPNEEWKILTEQDQDIMKPLNYENDSIDCIFTEHVWEHLIFEGAISFAKESLRVLKKGGILRTVCPTIDKMIQLKNDALSKHYADTTLIHYFPEHDKALRELGLDGIREEPIAFMFDSLIKGHLHKFVWTSKLIKKVLQKIGFSEVYVFEPGMTIFDESNCLERVIRGANPEYIKKEFGIEQYDPESMVIEAKK